MDDMLLKYQRKTRSCFSGVTVWSCRTNHISPLTSHRTVADGRVFENLQHCQVLSSSLLYLNSLIHFGPAPILCQETIGRSYIRSISYCQRDFHHCPGENMSKFSTSVGWKQNTAIVVVVVVVRFKFQRLASIRAASLLDIHLL